MTSDCRVLSFSSSWPLTVAFCPSHRHDLWLSRSVLLIVMASDCRVLSFSSSWPLTVAFCPSHRHGLWLSRSVLLIVMASDCRVLSFSSSWPLTVAFCPSHRHDLWLSRSVLLIVMASDCRVLSVSTSKCTLAKCHYLSKAILTTGTCYFQRRTFRLSADQPTCWWQQAGHLLYWNVSTESTDWTKTHFSGQKWREYGTATNTCLYTFITTPTKAVPGHHLARLARTRLSRPHSGVASVSASTYTRRLTPGPAASAGWQSSWPHHQQLPWLHATIRYPGPHRSGPTDKKLAR